MSIFQTESPSAAATTTSESFEKVLQAYGFKRNSRSWNDYEVAKRIINRLAMSSQHYDRLIAVTVQYLGI